MARKAKLIDVTLCTACRGCQSACKNWNQLPAVQTQFTGSYENPPEFMPTTWTRVTFNEYRDNGKVRWLFAKKQCMHCGEAACYEICPVDAISYSPLGTVNIDYDTCIGCGACAGVCPFKVPRVDPVDNKAKKCTLCYELLTNGITPACMRVCPLEVMSYGDREEMIALGEEKVAALQANGYGNAQLYGVDELGGLGTVYVLADSPAAYGLPENPTVSASFYLWKVALGPVRTMAVAGLAAGVIAGWLKMRREEVVREKEKV